MAETSTIGRTLCPWCHNELEVAKSAKSGYHYANCKSCNAHFRNVPITLVDMKGKEKPEPKAEAEESALARLKREVEAERKSQPESESGASALERIKREVWLK